MTRVLVVSDSHGSRKNVEIALKHPHDIAIHCGDFTDQQDFYTENFDYVIRGNNDYDSNLKDTVTFQIENFKCILTHGHLISKWNSYPSKEEVITYAKSNKVDIAFFGHTHFPTFYERDKCYAINPGSIFLPRQGPEQTYLILEIDKNDIKFEFKQI